ncbi:Hpt domain-containing protein [uncultured Pseudodesulfovibrio sp.]|uniref:Hpt domain-containing protein n=1 Tax=uncultured Pseudodesulfovibrio sp. TaxID=2035858 RepID=UPI0029C6CFB9|nr:Hpt domain-containing protein [uncultured Pseudodesulfovibrio sp.]
MKKFQVIVDVDLKSIMPRYFEIQREELGKMESAIQTGDGTTLSKFGHRLKGTGTSYGFARLTELGAAVEIAGREARFDEARTLTAEIRAYLENVDIIYGEIE